MKDIILRAIEKWGHKRQQVKAVEELGELQNAVLRNLDGRGNYNNLVEEIADVEIMLLQLKMIYGIPFSEVEEMKAKKILRLRSRIEAEEGFEK